MRIINQHLLFDISELILIMPFNICKASVIKIWLIDVFHQILTSYIQSIVYMCTVFHYKRYENEVRDIPTFSAKVDLEISRNKVTLFHYYYNY